MGQIDCRGCDPFGLAANGITRRTMTPDKGEGGRKGGKGYWISETECHRLHN
jgi:hypothetical protein